MATIKKGRKEGRGMICMKEVTEMGTMSWPNEKTDGTKL